LHGLGNFIKLVEQLYLRGDFGESNGENKRTYE